MMQDLLVSFIVPSYNYAHMIGRCIDSILAQTYTHWELIVVDDLSTDASLEVLKRYTDPRIRVFVNEKRLGIYGNITAGIARASGDTIKIVMADDWLHENYLRETLRLFEQHPTIGFCSVRTQLYNETGQVITTYAEPEPGRSYYPRDRMLWWTTRAVNPIGNPSRVIFKRAAYDAVNGFDLAIEYCTELDMWIRMLEHWDCGYVPQVLSYETSHSANATRDYVRDARHLTTGEQMFDKLFNVHPYYKGQWRRQQAIWLYGWRDYWMAAIRHRFEGRTAELNTLIRILRRHVPLIFWLPLIVWRFGQVTLRKMALRLRYE